MSKLHKDIEGLFFQPGLQAHEMVSHARDIIGQVAAIDEETAKLHRLLLDLTQRRAILLKQLGIGNQ